MGRRNIFYPFLLTLFFKKLFFIKKIMENSISVVVCSRDNNEVKEKVVNHIKETCECNAHTYFMYNPDGVGLSDIYNSMLSEEKSENDIIVFIHDDIEFLKKGWGREILRLFNEHEDYGIIGVAGSAEFDERGAWWQYDKKYGQVLHRHDGKSWLTAFSPLLDKDLQEVCVIDGLFIAVHRKRISKKFDESLKKFDFYDISFCLDSYLDGQTKIGVTTNIRIAHNSIGQMREGWYTAREYINQKYKGNFPIKVE
jgi:hypothetical protein